MERAEYMARVDESLCTGCGNCDSRCHFKAIDSVMESGQALARVDPLRCFGCGLCRESCSVGAISLVLR
jgi:heterodisulfide reductase subunit A-like polyferredoxin